MSADEAVLEALQLPVVIVHPPEPVVKTSIAAALGGLCLIAGVVLLALFNWAAQGEKDGKPDVFGKRVTVREVEARAAHGKKQEPGLFFLASAFLDADSAASNHSSPERPSAPSHKPPLRSAIRKRSAPFVKLVRRLLAASKA